MKSQKCALWISTAFANGSTMPYTAEFVTACVSMQDINARSLNSCKIVQLFHDLISPLVY